MSIEHFSANDELPVSFRAQALVKCAIVVSLATSTGPCSRARYARASLRRAFHPFEAILPAFAGTWAWGVSNSVRITTLSLELARLWYSSVSRLRFLVCACRSECLHDGHLILEFIWFLVENSLFSFGRFIILTIQSIQTF